MTQFSKQLIKTTFIILLGLLLSSSVYAFQLDYPDWFLKETREKMAAGETSLVTLVGELFNVFLVIAGVAAFIMIVVGGFRYLTSMGDPSKMGDAKNQIFSALLGLALLLGSYLILNTINPELVALKEPDLEKMTKLPLARVGTISVRVIEPEISPSTFAWDINTGIKYETLYRAVVLKVDTDNKKAYIIEGVDELWSKDFSSRNFVSLDKTFHLAIGEDLPIKLTITKIEPIAGIPGKTTIEATLGVWHYGPKEIKQLTTVYTKDEGPFRITVDPGAKEEMKLTVGVNILGHRVEKEIGKKTLDMKGGTFTIDESWEIPFDKDYIPEKYRQKSGDKWVIPAKVILNLAPSPEYKVVLFFNKDWSGDRTQGLEVVEQCYERVWDKIRSIKIDSGYAIKIYATPQCSTLAQGWPGTQWAEICFKNFYDDLEKCELGAKWGEAKGTWEDDLDSFKIISAAECSDVDERQTFLCEQGKGCEAHWTGVGGIPDKDTACPASQASPPTP